MPSQHEIIQNNADGSSTPVSPEGSILVKRGGRWVPVNDPLKAHNDDAAAHGLDLTLSRELARESSQRSIDADQCVVTSGTIVALDTGGVALTRDDSSTSALLKIAFPCDARNRFLVVDLEGDANLARVDIEQYIASDSNPRWDRLGASNEAFIKGARMQFCMKPSYWTGGPAFTYAKLADYRAVGIKLYSSGASTTLKIHSVRLVRSLPPPGGIVIWFDDGYESVYTKAFPKMKAAGLVGTFAVHTSLIGTAGYCSLSQLMEMQAAGWSIVSHNQTDGTQNETTFKAARDWLRANGLSGYRHHVFVGGIIAGGILEAAKKVFLSTRLVGAGTQLLWPSTNRFLHFGGYVTSSTTLAELKTKYADDQKNFGGVWGVVFHGIEDGAAGVAVTQETFDGFIDYLAANGTRSYTPEQLFDAGRI